MQHTGWAQLQEWHYRNTPNCKKMGVNWASKLQFELWGLWTHHQEVHCEAPTADDMVILDEAKAAILEELATGTATLPPLHNIYFNTTEEHLFTKTATNICVWLAVLSSRHKRINL